MSIKELKKILTANPILGTKETIKRIKQGKINKVFLASNCREDIKKQIHYYAKIGKIEVYEMKETSAELGTVCKKPYAISVLSA